MIITWSNPDQKQLDRRSDFNYQIYDMILPNTYHKDLCETVVYTRISQYGTGVQNGNDKLAYPEKVIWYIIRNQAGFQLELNCLFSQ